MNLHNGQGLDIYWRENLICPTEAEYRRMVIDSTSYLLYLNSSKYRQSLTRRFKETGGLFRLAVSLMQEFSSNNR